MIYKITLHEFLYTFMILCQNCLTSQYYGKSVIKMEVKLYIWSCIVVYLWFCNLSYQIAVLIIYFDIFGNFIHFSSECLYDTTYINISLVSHQLHVEKMTKVAWKTKIADTYWNMTHKWQKLQIDKHTWLKHNFS